MAKKCKYCAENRAIGHMQQKHPEILQRYRSYIQDSYDKQRAEVVHEREVFDIHKWRRYGNRIG